MGVMIGLLSHGKAQYYQTFKGGVVEISTIFLTLRGIIFLGGWAESHSGLYDLCSLLFVSVFGYLRIYLVPLIVCEMFFNHMNELPIIYWILTWSVVILQ